VDRMNGKSSWRKKRRGGKGKAAKQSVKWLWFHREAVAYVAQPELRYSGR
jgi:hypothetical protein